MRLLPSPQERTRLNGITCHDGYCEVVCQERLMGGENVQDVKDMAVPGFIKECFSCVLIFLGFLAFDFLDIEAAMLTELRKTATAEGGWTNLLPNLFRASSFNNGIEATLTCPARF